MARKTFVWFCPKCGKERRQPAWVTQIVHRCTDGIQRHMRKGEEVED